MRNTKSAKSSAQRDANNLAPGALKLKPAAEYLGGLSVPTMHRLIQRGLLRPCRATRHLLFPKKELDRFLMT
jgi:excisionase family DNA binding protein